MDRKALLTDRFELKCSAQRQDQLPDWSRMPFERAARGGFAERDRVGPEDGAEHVTALSFRKIDKSFLELGIALAVSPKADASKHVCYLTTRQA
jgi:hypothetical protein